MSRPRRRPDIATVVEVVLLVWAAVLIVGGLARGLLLPVLGGIVIGIMPLIRLAARRALDKG